MEYFDLTVAVTHWASCRNWPDMSLSTYLAKNYLTSTSTRTGDPSDLSSRPKKRRKKDKHSIHGLVITDTDEDLDLRSSRTLSRADEDDFDRPHYDTHHRSAEFKRSKKNSWKTISTSAPNRGPQDAADAAAEAILASAVAEHSAHVELDMDDAPTVVDDSTNRLSTGAKAGLQTAADTALLELDEERQRNMERKAQKIRKQSRKESEAEKAEQTVYRDATGRRIDISMKRAEARAAEQEILRAEQKAKEDAMGAVQLQEREVRKKDLEEAKFLSLARGVDDEDMNEDMKKQIRWDDPMAAYMAKKEAEQEIVAGRSRNGVEAGTKTVKKEYQGAAPPNRYGIKPGWRWDGVDRGNGFEKEWFQARGKKARTENLEYQWQMDE